MNVKSAFPILMLIAALLGGGKAYIDYVLSKQLNQFMQQNPYLVHYQTVSLSLLGDVVIYQLQLKIPQIDQIIEIKQLTVSQAYLLAMHNWQQWPAKIKLYADQLTLTLPNTTSSPPMLLKLLGYDDYYLSSAELHQLGYNEIKANVQVIIQVTEKKGQLDIQMNAEQWGKLTMAAETLSMPTPAQWQLDNLPLSTIAAKYENNGLFEQILSFLAQRQSIPLDIFKQTLINKINHDILQSKVLQETIVLTHLQQFFDTLTNITIYMYTDQLITLQNVVTMNPTKLHLKITANEVN